MFKCKCCPEKDTHIKSLKEHIFFLQGQLAPLPVDYATQEANHILNGAAMPIIEVSDPNSERSKEQRRVDQEASDILTGSY